MTVREHRQDLTERERKQALRREIYSRIKNLPPAYCKEADQQILHYLTALKEYREAQTVFCYVGVAHEINTLPFLQAVLDEGKTLAVPLCTKGGIMEARQIDSMEDLRPGRFDIPEPVHDAPLIRPKEIDLAIIPCLSCAPGGARLGHGGGYYDRYFQEQTIPTVMLCRARLLSETIPTEAFDIRFPRIITENGLLG